MRKNCIQFSDKTRFDIAKDALLNLGFFIASNRSELKIHFGSDEDTHLINKIKHELFSAKRPAQSSVDLANRIMAKG